MYLKDHKLTKEEYEYYMRTRVDKGSEGIISYYSPNEVIKIFHDSFGQNEFEKIEETRERKAKKIILYATKEDLKNPLKVTRTVTYRGKFAGYIETIAPGIDLKKIFENLSIEEKLGILRKSKDILLDFHEHDIIHGDVRAANIVYDSDSETVTFVDIDNAKIDGIDPEIKNQYLSYFYNPHGPFDEVVDSIEHNILTIQLVSNFKESPYLYQYIAAGKFPKLVQNRATRGIIKGTLHATPETKEAYLIDCIKELRKNK